MMAALPDTIKVGYKVPTRRHPMIAFAVQQPLGTAGLIVIFLMIFAAIFAEWVAPHDPLTLDYGGLLAPPSADHLLGTDNFGRDVLSRVIYGSQTALAVGFLSSLIGSTLGAVIGVASAYFGGMTDMIIQRLMDVILAFPILVLALADFPVGGMSPLQQRIDHRVLEVGAPPPGDDGAGIAAPPLGFQERGDVGGEPALHVDDRAVLVEHDDLDAALERFDVCHAPMLARIRA